MTFNEDSRVKLPAVLHLMSLGYGYISLKDHTWDKSCNIFTDIFFESIQKLNAGIEETEIKKIYADLTLALENNDLGKAFYEKITNLSNHTLIDFDNFTNNSLHVVTELPCEKDEDSFRPDITLLINGLPLVFIEVKKPNNKEGIQKERERMEKRFANKKFRNFFNATQLMIFSNNMEYDDNDPLPLQGAFYATTAYQIPVLNYFREEENFDLSKLLKPISEEIEKSVLIDNNLPHILNTPEYITNKKPTTPTHEICTSLLQPSRLSFILRYGLAYVKESHGLEKHIMRYPQLFATHAIAQKLDAGIKKGIVWHTQGSGKTALTYFNVKFLTDYFQQKKVIAKFYFIVDRIDLLVQAKREFEARGLSVNTIQSRDAFASEMAKTMAVHNDSGKAEITVVNIQKFQDDPNVMPNTDYSLNVQRVFFLDEVHRSYNPKGSFLANLEQADKQAIKIGLTGTPLLGTEYNSKSLFGDYIHKYYYNLSIKDGYTLRLIREEVETSYKMQLKATLEEIDILKGDGDRRLVYAHHRFVEPMLDYIVKDFEQSRLRLNDSTIGGMVICDSSDQAKMMYEIFQEKYAEKNELLMAAEAPISYGDKKLEQNKVKRAALILHDVGSKDDIKNQVEEFKDGKIDFLFVYNMLLTGFDAKRLKKLYIGRVIKAHNLLQALTRVNRTYKNHKYGFVVDFADIQSEFDKTNKAYFDELQSELGDEMQHYSDLFKSVAEIEAEIEEIKEVLFYFDTTDKEIFRQQLDQINDRKQVLELVKALENARSLYNMIRLMGHFDLLQKIDFQKINVLAREANARLSTINTRDALNSDDNSTNLLNEALEDVIFAFTKIKEEEMVLADQLKDILHRTRTILGGNIDQADPYFISLKEELERLFKKKNLTEVTKADMETNIDALQSIYTKAYELERKNNLLKAKYQQDAKYVRLHKRLMEKDPITEKESKLFEALNSFKADIDQQILQNSNMMENESYLQKLMLKSLLEHFKTKHQLDVDAAKIKQINTLIVNEYLAEYRGRAA